MTPQQWITRGEVGISSKTIWAVLMGIETEPQPVDHYCGRYGVPHDPADFDRCYKLLALSGEWRNRIDDVAKVFPAWKPFVDAWAELESLYIEELPANIAPKLYARIQELLNESMILDGWVKTSPYSWESRGEMAGVKRIFNPSPAQHKE